MKDGCGFLFVRYKRPFCTELISWEHVACPLSGIKRHPLVGGWLNTSCIVFSIRAIASVRYREVVHSWEGPLWEAPLYMYPLQLCSLTVSLPSDPTFTTENVLEMTREVDYFNLTLNILRVPVAKKFEIDDQFQSTEQCREAAVSHVLLTHPCPSWRWLSRRLQRLSNHSAAAAADVEVSRKYVKGE